MTVLAELRRVLPKRALTRTEAYVLAERQATLLLKLSNLVKPPVPTTVVSRLPFLTVAVRTPMRSSGATRWVKPRWIVLLNGMEPPARQRFSLGHELKHIIDHEHAKQFFPRVMSSSGRLSVEQLCDFFAGSLWMPRPWVKRAFASGTQDTVDLARLFEVSPQAMHVRLLQLGLIDPYARHSEMDNAYLRSKSVSPLELAA